MEAFGDEWWERGIERSLDGEILKNLQGNLERNPDSERHFLLDASHFPWIVSSNHNQVFADAFPDSQRSFQDLRRLVGIRNEWAHVQEMPTSRAWQAADLMKHVLASLRCEETVEVDRMIQDFVFEPDAHSSGDVLVDLDPGDDEIDIHDMRAAPKTFWHQIQSYLSTDKAVRMPDDPSNEDAKIVIRAHNTAPDSKDWPSVHFRSVIVRDSNGNEYGLGDIAPGESREIECKYYNKELIGIEFSISGHVDASKLFQFSRSSTLPEDVISPLRQEFVHRLESIAVREFVEDVLNLIGNPDPNMTFADIARIRASIKETAQQIEEKRTLLGSLSKDFRLARASTLGGRTREIILSLVEFEKKLSALDEAIGQTNLDLMNEAVSNLKQVQLSVIRLEDAIKTLATGS